MATNSVAIVLPHGRRFTIKVTSNTSIQQILEEACVKAGLKSNETDLTHQRKVLDTGLTVRFANLPNNCNLELQPSKNGPKIEKLVTVGLQLESGERLLHDFASSTTLSEIIQYWSNTKVELLEQGKNSGEPVCIYMRKEIIGEEEFKKTNLSQLGVTSGRVMIRFLYRIPSSLKEQAYVEDICLKKTVDPGNWENPKIGETSKTELNELESATSGPSQVSSPEPIQSSSDLKVENAKILVDSAASNNNMETEDAYTMNQKYIEDVERVLDVEMEDEEESEDNIVYIGEREALLFNLDSVPKLQMVDLPDEFFEHTERDVRYLYSDLKKQIQSMENKPLMLASAASQMKEDKLLQYESAIVRVHFPDRFVLQAKFAPQDKVMIVKDFIRQFLTNPNSDFFLYTTPPKNILNDEMTLIQVDLVPAAVVYFGCDQKDGTTFLKEELKSQVSSLRAATRKASKFRSRPVSSISNQQLEIQNSSPSTSGNSLRRDQNGLDNVSRVRPVTKNPPKWFKLSK